MKRVFTLLSVAAFALALPGAAVAAEKKTTAAKAADAVKDTAAKVTGAVKPIPMNSRADTIDARGKTFTMKRKADGAEVKHVVTDTTEIKNGDAAAKFSDIKAGDTVSGLRLKKSDTEYEVVKITKFGPAAPKAAADAKPAEKKP
jgi:hypothetical protein